MTSSQFARLHSLFDAAVSLPEQERVGFIEASTPVEEELRSAVLAMLKANENTDFLSSPAVPPLSLLSGSQELTGQQQIGNYRILRELGRGGMGTVYMAVRSDDTFRKVVALKVISPGAARSDFVERFKQERQILAGLEHPDVARILDGGATEDGRPYYVMEYVDGLPIDAFCDRGRASVGERVQILAQVCDAVQYLHDHAVIHRDLKPSNILVTADGRAKLLDFGIAKVQTADPGMAPAPPTMLMTPVYASPEQIEGRPLTKSSDVYSLGIILYKLLTGRLPFVKDDGTHDLTLKLSGAEPMPPSKSILDVRGRTGQEESEFRRRMNGDLDLIVLLALKADSSRRYASACIFGEDLRRYLTERPVLARADGLGYRVRKFVARNRLAVALAAALVMMAGVSAGLEIQTQIERVRVSAKEDDLERYLSFLDSRVSRWSSGSGDPGSASESDQLADVRGVHHLLLSDIPQVAASRGGDANRVKRLLGNVLRLLDRADRMSQNQAAVRKEVGVAYREAGDLQATSRLPEISDKQQAVASYKRAGAIAASVGSADRAWVETQLSQLSGRLSALGARLDEDYSTRATPSTAQQAVPEQNPQPRAADPRPATKLASSKKSPAANPEAAPSAPWAVEASELKQRLVVDQSNASRAGLNVRSLQERLPQGQVVHADTMASLARVTAFLEIAEAELGRMDSRKARINLEKAEYEMKKIFLAVGD